MPDGAGQIAEWSGERWPTFNEALRMNRHVRNKATKEWLERLSYALHGTKPMGIIRVEMLCFIPHRGRRDTDADMWLLKVWLDTVAAAGVISDDTATYVEDIRVHRPQMGAADWGTRLLIKPGQASGHR